MCTSRASSSGMPACLVRVHYSTAIKSCPQLPTHKECAFFDVACLCLLGTALALALVLELSTYLCYRTSLGVYCTSSQCTEHHSRQHCQHCSCNLVVSVRQMEDIIAEGSKPDPAVPALSFDKEFARSFWDQYRICLWKFNITYWRTPNYNATRFSFSLAVALIFGACFWKLGGSTRTEQQVYNTLGALLTSTLFLGILNSIFVQPVVSAERAVFYRERAAGMYSVGPWYLALVSQLLVLCFLRWMLFCDKLCFLRQTPAQCCNACTG